MARNEREVELIKAARELFYTKGYENTSIQDIIDAVGVSRGAFYHHFESKQAVLESVVDGLSEQIEAVIRPILDHPTHTALEKFDNMLQSLSSWKAGQREQVLGLLRVMNSDENLPLQHKLKAARMQFAIPAFTQTGFRPKTVPTLCLPSTTASTNLLLRCCSLATHPPMQSPSPLTNLMRRKKPSNTC